MLWLRLAAALAILGPASLEADTVSLSSEHKRLLLIGIAEKASEGFRLTDVRVAPDPASPGVMFVCGKYDSPNNPRSFVALIYTDPFSDQQKIGSLNLAESDQQEQAAASICARKISVSERAFAAGDDVLEALRSYKESELFCSVGDKESCDKRRAALDDLREFGWCLGDGAEFSDDWGDCAN